MQNLFQPTREAYISHVLELCTCRYAGYPLFVFNRVSMSRVNMLTLDCDWDNCDFQTPPLNREHYQAMLAHLQVIKDLMPMGKSLFFARILFELLLPDSLCTGTRSFPTFSFCGEPDSLRL